MLGCALTVGCTANELSGGIETQVSVDSSDDAIPASDDGPIYPSAPLAGPSVAPSYFQLNCDDSATCCPPGLSAVVGSGAGDVYSTADLDKCHVTLGGGPVTIRRRHTASPVNAPNVAVRNNSNYEWYARWISRAYTHDSNTGCDETNNAPCTPSDCCGNGAMEPGEGEECDTTDFGGGAAPTVTCENYGYSQGFLQCSSDCQTIDPSRCFGRCGNGMVDLARGEECDGNDLNGMFCDSFGFEMGSLSCNPDCTLNKSGCTGGISASPPASYGDCGVTAQDCDNKPEGCQGASQVGFCPGGPCLRTDPGNDSERDNPFSSCHPRGDFVDALVNLHYCESFQGIEMTCVDEVGWGVCKRCGVDTMLGCSCNNDDGCGKTADVLG